MNIKNALAQARSVHNLISEAKEDFIEARKRLQEVVKDIQKCCEHEYVIQLEFGCAHEYSNARRICPNCTYEEEGSTWSSVSVWSKHDFTKSVLCNSDDRVVEKTESSNYFYSFRL